MHRANVMAGPLTGHHGQQLSSGVGIFTLPEQRVLEALSAIARKRRDERDGTTCDLASPLLADREPLTGKPDNSDDSDD